MSVIFKTLEKVRNASRGEEEKGSKLRRSRNFYSFRRMVISPLGVLCFAILLILSGLFSTYGGNFFGDYFSGNHKQRVTRKANPTLRAAVDARPEHQALREKNTSVEVSGNAEETPHEEDLPQPPADIPVGEAKPGRLYLPSANLKKTSPPVASNPQYLPPKSQTRLEAPSPPLPGKKPLKTEYMEQRTITFQPGETPPGVPDVARAEDTTYSARPQGEKEPVLSARLHRDSLAVSGLIPEEPPSTSKEGRAPKAERIYRVNLEKAARVGRMVSKIERSMIEGDMDRAKVLIDQLAELKGEQNAYLLKLRAVWQMRQGAYESAARLLTKVLEKEKDDLEAGINMAIIEIKTHRLDEARKRLAGLREIYQANTLIPELIREIGG